MNLLEQNKLLSVQHRLFENAHKTPHEIKSVVIDLKSQGSIGDKIYMHPDAMRTPIERCELLCQLDSEHKAVLSAIDYALTYRRVANNEHIAISANMAAARCSFSDFSNDYMLLFQETMEEYDHIWSFLTLDRWVMQQLSCAKESYDFSRFNGDRSSDRDLSRRFSAPVLPSLRSWLINFISYKGMEVLPKSLSNRFGLGAIWFFRRYLANILLKQKESFLHAEANKFDYHPNAVNLSGYHGKDEARHYTTSLELGKELYKMASPSGQKLIRAFFKSAMNSFVKTCFTSQHERLLSFQRGASSEGWTLPSEILILAFKHPSFKGIDLDIKELEKKWIDEGVYCDYSDLDKKRGRFIAQQVRRLADFLEIQVCEDRSHSSFVKYQELLAR